MKVVEIGRQAFDIVPEFIVKSIYTFDVSLGPSNMSRSMVLTSSLRFTEAILVCPCCQIDNLHQIANPNPEAHVWFLDARLSQHCCGREGICKLQSAYMNYE